MKKYKIVIIAAVIITAALVLAFVFGGKDGQTPVLTSALNADIITTAAQNDSYDDTAYTQPQATQALMTASADEGQTALTDNASTTQQPAAKVIEETQAAVPTTEAPAQTAAQDEPSACTISISCATILNNMDKLDKNKAGIIPSDGWILKPLSMSYEEGESAFDLLKRVCRENKIHLEFVMTPVYNTAYIEGIGNIYEFDCGSLSGWEYTVNGDFMNYGCSEYTINSGDVLRFEFTCDMGRDIGWAG